MRPLAAPPEPFAIGVREHRGRFVLTLAGELDLATAPILAFELRRVDECHPARAVIDLGRLRFMDLSGVRLLVTAQERAREHGYDVAVVVGCGGARRILELVGAQVVLNLVSDPSTPTELASHAVRPNGS